MKPPGKRPEPAPRDRALALLARREHSARELKRKLRQRGVADPDADTVIEEMQGRDYQSDPRFAETLLRRRAADGYGPQRIRAELASHGISRAAISAVFAENDIDFRAIARRIYQSRYRDEATTDDPAARRKRAAWLAQRGFDGDCIRAVTACSEDGD